tara:strand:- start:459 stop:1028 length:570 start_codon:yes stop_codon:yes gene_type:complete
MADTENINFMKNLMSKMEGKSTSSTAGKKTTAGGKDIIMEQILDKFTKAVETSASDVIKKEDPPVVVDEDKVVTTKWIIENVGKGSGEVDYVVKDRKSGNIIVEGLYTYTIANKFAQLLNKGHVVNSSKFQELLALNQVFESKFEETQAYKQRIKTANEAFKIDLYEAKLQTAKDRAFEVLQKIQSFDK